MVRDFNPGTLSASTWTSRPFNWLPTACSSVMSAGTNAFTCEPVEGVYSIEVVAKNFTSGETTSKTVKFQVTPLVTGSTPIIVGTANPLVSLFSAPACASGSSIRVSFQEQSLGYAGDHDELAAMPCHDYRELRNCRRICQYDVSDVCPDH